MKIASEYNTFRRQFDYRRYLFGLSVYFIEKYSIYPILIDRMPELWAIDFIRYGTEWSIYSKNSTHYIYKKRAEDEDESIEFSHL